MSWISLDNLQDFIGKKLSYKLTFYGIDIGMSLAKLWQASARERVCLNLVDMAHLKIANTIDRQMDQIFQLHLVGPSPKVDRCKLD